VTYERFFSGIPFASTNKIDCHDIAEILLKVVLNTIIRIKRTALAVIGIYKVDGIPITI
jgi:hypothetical protein